ncbi:MAG: hypothetical protein L0323_23255 [Planctomycetes bacterium]|nr:hypothetical protein [Planctomycetota bacterium]
MKLSTLVVGGMLAASARSQSPPWFTTGPVGGRIREIEINPLAIFVGGNRMTPHFGFVNAWSRIREASGLPPNARDFAWSPVNPSILYAANMEQELLTGGVFQTADGGATWVELTSGLSVKGKEYRAAACNPTNSVTAYVGNTASAPAPAQGVYVTSDGGATWAHTSLAQFVNALAVSPTDPDTVFAATNGGVFSTEDGGSNWAQVSPGSSFDIVVHPLGTEVYAVGDGGVTRSLDGGHSWSQAGSLPSSFVGRGVSLAPTAPLTTVFASGADNSPPALFSNDGVIHRSTDAGTTWTQLSTVFPHNPCEAVAVDPVSNNTLYAGVDGRGLFRSLDALAPNPTFSDVNGGLIGTRVLEIAAQVQVIGPGSDKVFAGGDSRTVWFRDPTTGVWTANDVPDIPNGCNGWAPIGAIAFDPDVPQNRVYVEDCQRIQFSDDDGATWSPTVSGFGLGNDVTEIAVGRGIAPGSGQSFSTLLVGTATGAFRSTDGGLTFQAVAGSPAFVEDFSFVLQYPNVPTILAAVPTPAAGVGGMWISVNDGQAWTRPANAGLPSPELSTAFDVSGAGAEIYGGSSTGTLEGVYRSTDFGASWTLTPLGGLTSLQRQVVGVTIGAGGSVLASTRGGVLRTTNQGTTWTAFSNGLFNTRCGKIAVAGVAGSMFNYVATEGGGVSRVPR